MQGLECEYITGAKTNPAGIQMPEWLEQKLVDELRFLYAEAVERAGRAQHEGPQQLERAVQKRVLEIGARILQASLARGLGKGYIGSVVRCEHCGGRMRYVKDLDKVVTTIVGQVRIRRAYYCCRQCKRSTIPLDRILRVEGRSFSSAVQEGACLLSAEVPFDRAQELLGRLCGVQMSTEECRVIAEDFGNLLERRDQQEIEKVWQAKTPTPREANENPARLYVSPDGTQIPTRAGWSEARVATIFTTKIPLKGKDPVRENTRHVAGVEDARGFYKRLYVEALKQGVDQAKEVVVVADGASWIWNHAELAFPKKRVEIIDYYHASEKVWELARAMWGDESLRTKQWAARWTEKLYRGKTDAFISAMGRLLPRSKEAREIKRKTLSYFRGNRARMRYGEFRRRGYFIGSGVTESSCKHLVGARLKQAGMRWECKQANAILQLRVARLNDRWNHLWN